MGFILWFYSPKMGQKFIVITIFFIIVEADQTKTPSYLKATKTSATSTKLFLPLTKNSDRIHNENIATKVISIFNDRTPQHPTIKNWQVGRVSRKQYENINMLWRKTNIFTEYIEKTSPGIIYRPINRTRKRIIRQQKLSKVPQNFADLSLRNSLPSTPSYIEFYYLDETENTQYDTPKSEKQLIGHRKLTPENFSKFKSFSRSPFFAFHVNGPGSVLRQIPYTRTLHTTAKSMPLITKQKILLYSYDVPLIHVLSAMKQVTSKLGSYKPSLKLTINLTVVTNSPVVRKTNKQTSHSSQNNSKFVPTKMTVNYNKPSSLQIYKKDVESSNKLNRDNYNDKNSTTINDKVKFFELYDSNTYDSFHKKFDIIPLNKDDNENPFEDHDMNLDQRILHQHIDQDDNVEDVLNKTWHANKRFSTTKILTSENSIKSTVRTNYSYDPNFKELFHSKEINSEFASNISRFATWSQYPFVAVYVYERYQVHCDAVIISPHWLMAAGSCLSRHSDDHTAEGRSAFVSYCGENWWHPERIAYVKYSVVHPKYHPHDRNRRQLYNIGVIQVISSMASVCSNWRPVSMMSHRFRAEFRGSIATAVGWGLDRYTSTMLPRIPLTVYESLVFSDFCPGNTDYRKAKYGEEDGVKNVYCLSLPFYVDEQSDPIHGGLLLVGEKLIALYLQEERRQWGDQSAQYTGVWRLVPWLHEVAREPEEIEFVL